MNPDYQFFVIEFINHIEHQGFDEYLTLEYLQQEIALPEKSLWKIIFPFSKKAGLEVMYKVALHKALPPTRRATDREILMFVKRQG